MTSADIALPDDSGNTNPLEAYVYVIVAGDDAVKVGLARDTLNRLKALQTGHYKKLFIAHQVGFPTVDEAYVIERRAHRLLRAKRIEGEWFSVSAHEAMLAIGQAINGIEDERRLEEEAQKSAMRRVDEGPHVYLGPEITEAESWMRTPKDVIRFVLAQKDPLKREYLFNFGDCVIFVACRTEERTGEHFFFMNDVSRWHMREEDGSPYDASRVRIGNPLGKWPGALFATVYEPSRVAA
jgi:hypothetical protein